MTARIFISYKRDVDDQLLCDALCAALVAQGHQVFMDRRLLVGEPWRARLQHEIETCDYFILLLSKDSILSDMVAEEIRIAYRAWESGGKARILPIRLGQVDALPYDLAAILNPIQYAVWQSNADTARVIAELQVAFAGAMLPLVGSENPAQLAADLPVAAANPRRYLETPGGTMDADSAYYVSRLQDREAHAAQQQAHYTLVIKGSRQVGKSSLLARAIGHARQIGQRVVYIDFQGFGSAERNDPNLLYHQFCWMIQDQLELTGALEKAWALPLSFPLRAQRFMEYGPLRTCEHGLLLAIDEADALIGSPARNDFFGMLRAWQNNGAAFPHWKRLSLALVISTEPALLIDNLSQSPFNRGSFLNMADFSLAEVADANQQHGNPLDTAQLAQFYALLKGQPFLTRRGLYALCQNQISIAALFAEAGSESGIFGDHLRALLTRLNSKPGLGEILFGALKNGYCEADGRMKLIAGGLLQESDNKLVVRNELYYRYFCRVLKND